MATKAEARRAQDERHGPSPKARKRAQAKKTRADKLAVVHESKRAGKKASYAREVPSKTGSVSRKSTRRSKNRSKPDSNLTLRQERRTRAPSARAERATRSRARASASP
jgi:hypothetical protein